MNHYPLRRPNILVMHQDPILCAGLVAALRRAESFVVFVHAVDTLEASGSRMDAVVADYDSAMHLAEQATRRAGPLAGARILALTANDREAEIRRAIEAGVYGYVLLGGPLQELVDAVKAVATGSRYMSLAVAQRMAESLTRSSLTPRETEVLRLVAMGQPNKAIARELGIELGTVKSHMAAIMGKLGAACRTQAARIAVARGLVDDHGGTRPRPEEAVPQAATRMARAGLAFTGNLQAWKGSAVQPGTAT